jgi:hypothetical protein
VAGVPFEYQPKFNFDLVFSDSIPQKSIDSINLGWIKYVSDVVGRDLPAIERKKLSSLYMKIYTSVSDIRADLEFKNISAMEAKRRISKVLAEGIIQDKEIFLSFPTAKFSRYGDEHEKVFRSTIDTAKIEAAMLQIIEGRSADSGNSDIKKTIPIRDRSSLKFGRHPYHRGIEKDLYCVPGTDTIVKYELAGKWEPYNSYESRVYLASHPAFNGALMILRNYGFPTNNFYHRSVVGSISQLEGAKVLKIVKKHRETCLQNDSSVLLEDFRSAIASDTSKWIWYRWKTISWQFANGSAGDYQSDDKLELRIASSFSSYDQAVKSLFVTVQNDDGGYPKAFAVSYSVGDFGIDWTCQNVNNAFSLRRYNTIVNWSPFGELYLGLLGRRGINPRMKLFSPSHFGCVPGTNCVFNLPPFALGVAEFTATGWGYNLSEYYNIRRERMQETGASYNPVGVSFPDQVESECCPTRGWE